jgi:hypothetical protein
LLAVFGLGPRCLRTLLQEPAGNAETPSTVCRGEVSRSGPLG